MIVSFSRKFVFVAVPKTAGHAVRTWLRGGLAAGDWEQSTLFERRLFPVAALAEIGHGHVSCEDIAPYLLPGMWDQFFTFGVVRDPYDRFRSVCGFHDPGLATSSDPLGGMKRLLEMRAEHFLFRPQHEFLCDAEGAVLVDRVARYERVDADMAEIGLQIGLPFVPLTRVNVTATRQDVPFDTELREMIASHYARDFAVFDYPIAVAA